MNRGICRSCGAPILWALTTKGKRMPVDERIYDDGNIILVDGVVHVSTTRPGTRKSHFSTCPNADSHRRPR